MRALWYWPGLAALLLLIAAGCGRTVGGDYDTAAWVLDKGGQVEIIDSAGNSLLVTPDDALPRESFKVQKVAWDIYPGDRNEAIGDADMARFTSFSELESLDLWTTSVTDAGLAPLAGLRSLKHLNLSETKITDAGLTHLTALAGLGRLYLTGTQVTDAGLTHLAEMKQLKFIDLTGTQVTKPGVQKLKRSLPGCIVQRGGRAPAGT